MESKEIFLRRQLYNNHTLALSAGIDPIRLCLPNSVRGDNTMHLLYNLLDTWLHRYTHTLPNIVQPQSHDSGEPRQSVYLSQPCYLLGQTQ